MVNKSMTNEETRTSNKFKKFILDCVRQKELILMVIPGIILVFIFSYIPIYGIIIAFKNYNPALGIMGSEWVGLKYFKAFFHNPFFWRLLKNTLLLGFYTLIFSFPAPIILALLIDQVQNGRFKKFVQTVSYFPHFISIVVIVGILKEFCAIDGLFNIISSWFGKEAISFLTQPGWFRTIFISSGIWQGIGWGTIIYLAALANVDPQLHEAATIDGANRWQRVRYINWPTILPTTTIMLIFAISGILGTDFQKVLLLYNEATYETADIISTYVYREGIMGGRYEYSTAIGLMMSFVSLILICFANRISKTFTENSLW